MHIMDGLSGHLHEFEEESLSGESDQVDADLVSVRQWGIPVLLAMQTRHDLVLCVYVYAETAWFSCQVARLEMCVHGCTLCNYAPNFAHAIVEQAGTSPPTVHVVMQESRATHVYYI